MNDLFLSELILILHVAWVAVVIIPVPLIVLGAWRHWDWIRNRWLRRIHLAMISVVVAETALGIACPLTVWEVRLRRAAGQAGYEGSFMGHLLRSVLYWDLPPWVFAVSYVAFLGLVVILYWVVPPVPVPRQRR